MNAIARSNCSPAAANHAGAVLNCDHGDPTMFEAYWDAHQEDYVQVSYANERLSYVVKNTGDPNGMWFVHEELENAIREIHTFVRNAFVRDRCIVVGTGSTQLFQAAVYALSNPSLGRSTSVGLSCCHGPCAVPAFPVGCDAKKFCPSNDKPFIELVTSPNNPCGSIRKPEVVKSSDGFLFYNLAYYWPMLIPISAAADNDIMFKCTGLGGSRLGWALVKGVAVAKKIGQFMSQDAQGRGAGWIANGHDKSIGDLLSSGKFSDYGKVVMEARWKAVRAPLSGNKRLPCKFLGTSFSTNADFIWLKCADGEDCQKPLKTCGMLALGRQAFSSDATYARLSLVGRQSAVDELIKRLACLSLE